MEVTIHVTGMTCSGCERRVENAVKALEGVTSATANYGKGELVAEFEDPCTQEAITEAIKATGYGVTKKSKIVGQTLAILIIILGLYVFADCMGWLEVFNNIPVIGSETMSYISLFLVGLLTSVHCVAMCGGMNLAQSLSEGNAKPLLRAILYNGGRLVSYTLIGALLGFIGEKAAISTQARAIIGLIAGIIMLFMGIRMLGGFSFRIRLFPKLSSKISTGIAKLGRYGSFIIGLANGLMPCGPLQSMQVYAIASGSWITGALSMFFFCLGTIPLVFIFGLTAGMLKMRWRQIMLKVGSVLLIVISIYMISTNLTLAGVNFPWSGSSGSDNAIAATVDGDAQYVTTALHSDGYEDIKVTVGIPVVWTMVVDEDELNGCNNEIIINEYGLQISLSTGDVVIEFTPEKTGTFTYTCWMGMLSNKIYVVDG